LIITLKINLTIDTKRSCSCFKIYYEYKGLWKTI